MDAVTFFLTYPRCELDHNDIINGLQQVKPVVWARVARERHQDQGLHIHAIVRFDGRVRTRGNARIFDIGGHHPNIQVPRAIKHVLEYCAKDGDFRDYGTPPTGKSKSGLYDTLVQAAKSGDRDAFDRIALESDVGHSWASHLWNRHGIASATIREPGGGTECMQLQGLQFSGQSTVVVGPSGCGKSTWAKRVAPKPALWVRHLDDLKQLTLEHKCIIFDDMDFSMLPRSTQIYIVDQNDQATIHCRHTNARIPANMPKIFTANKYPFTQDDEAIQRRLRVFNIVSLAI